MVLPENFEDLIRSSDRKEGIKVHFYRFRLGGLGAIGTLDTRTSST